MSWSEEEFLMSFNYGEVFYVVDYRFPKINLRRVRKKNKQLFMDHKVLNRTIGFMDNSLPIENGDMIFYTKNDETISVIKEKVTFV
jgi:hypothetical protein